MKNGQPQYLDERLLTAAQMVRPGARVADVGCDHGKLSVYLAQSGRASHVIAIDVREQPLAKARQLVQKVGCGSLVECRLADGLSCVKPEEIDCAVIAGVSGITVCDILEAAPWMRNAAYQLVTVPACKADVLRAYFAHSGFALEQEQAVLAADRPYPVISVRWNGKVWQPDEAYCRIGTLATVQGEAAQRYRQKVLGQLRRQLVGTQTGVRYSGQDQLQMKNLLKEVEQLCNR